MGSRWLDPNILPTFDAYNAKPYHVSEIDEHVDGARIWATLLQVREEAETKEEEESSEKMLLEDYREKLQAAMLELQDVINEG